MNEYFAQTLAGVLEETATNMGNALALEHLGKNGVLTIEEASFFHNLTYDVITEAAEDFIPDTLDVPDAPEPSAPIELYDAVGNKYVFQDGQLIPVDNDGDVDPDQGDVPVDTPDQGDVPADAPDQMNENTDIEGDVIEEGDNIVARILANLGD